MGVSSMHPNQLSIHTGCIGLDFVTKLICCFVTLTFQVKIYFLLKHQWYLVIWKIDGTFIHKFYNIHLEHKWCDLTIEIWRSIGRFFRLLDTTLSTTGNQIVWYMTTHVSFWKSLCDFRARVAQWVR